MDEPGIDVTDLLGAIARQAVIDYRNGYTSSKYMDAGAWLEEAGLLEAAQRSTAAQHAPHAGRRVSHEHVASPVAAHDNR